MNRHCIQRWALAVFSVCLMATGAWAQSLEIVKLQYRTAEEIIPALRPLLDAGGALSGEGFTLFVRTSPGNLAQLRQALQQLDRRPVQFLISVRNSTRQEIERERLAASAAIGTGGVRATVRATDTNARQQGNNASSVTVLEGNEAFIATGQNQSGFSVTPRQLGDQRVTLEINQQSRQRSSLTGRVESQSLSTQVSGRIGEWLELGGLSNSSSSTQSGILSRSYATSSDERSTWVKVELSP